MRRIYCDLRCVDSCVNEPMFETVDELGILEYVTAAGGHIMEAFGEVHCGFTLLASRGGHGIMPGTE